MAHPQRRYSVHEVRSSLLLEVQHPRHRAEEDTPPIEGRITLSALAITRKPGGAVSQSRRCRLPAESVSCGLQPRSSDGLPPRRGRVRRWLQLANLRRFPVFCLRGVPGFPARLRRDRLFGASSWGSAQAQVSFDSAGRLGDPERGDGNGYYCLPFLAVLFVPPSELIYYLIRRNILPITRLLLLRRTVFALFRAGPAALFLITTASGARPSLADSHANHHGRTRQRCRSGDNNGM
jgi:hypothetical protein